MVRFTRFHEKYVSVFLYLVAFLCNEFLKNRTDGRNENICIFSKNGLFNSESCMAIGGKVVRCLYRLIPFVAKTDQIRSLRKKRLTEISSRLDVNLIFPCVWLYPHRDTFLDRQKQSTWFTKINDGHSTTRQRHFTLYFLYVSMTLLRRCAARVPKVIATNATNR